jgi:hypothetical protein
MPHNPLGHQIDAAVVGLVDSFKGSVLREAPFFLRRERMRTAGIQIQRTAKQQKGVANRLCLQPPFGKGAEVMVRRVDGQRLLALAQGKLHLVDVSNGAPRLRGSLRLGDIWARDLVLLGDRALLLGETTSGETPRPLTRDSASAGSPPNRRACGLGRRSRQGSGPVSRQFR